jgi:hypothetical protein
MKRICFLPVFGLALVMAGCSSAPVALAPVGPNPLGTSSAAATGELQVFSSLVDRSEGDNPTWHQHSDYEVFDSKGHLVKRVDNSTGYYDQSPRQVALPPGKYLVKAEAQDYLSVKVPVEIENGRTTRVHLDDNWKPTTNLPKSEVVSAPDGQPVGWRAEPPKAFELK